MLKLCFVVFVNNIRRNHENLQLRIIEYVVLIKLKEKKIAHSYRTMFSIKFLFIYRYSKVEII